jgi:hypothetical protein
MDKIALKLQERLVQTCIDFINEHKDDEQIRQIERVEFSADCLQTSAKHGEWQPCTDSHCSLYGVSTESWKGFDLNEGYLIDASY